VILCCCGIGVSSEERGGLDEEAETSETKNREQKKEPPKTRITECSNLKFLSGGGLTANNQWSSAFAEASTASTWAQRLKIGLLGSNKLRRRKRVMRPPKGPSLFSQTTLGWSGGSKATVRVYCGN